MSPNELSQTKSLIEIAFMVSIEKLEEETGCRVNSLTIDRDEKGVGKIIIDWSEPKPEEPKPEESKKSRFMQKLEERMKESEEARQGYLNKLKKGR